MMVFAMLNAMPADYANGIYSFFFSSRRRHTRWNCDWSSDVCSSDLALRHAIERNRLHTALLDLALVDDLTGLYNRRGFLTLATRDLRLAHRGNETLLVAFADLDDLKGVNDAAGHAVGDRALRDTAALLRQTFRDSDLV